MKKLKKLTSFILIPILVFLLTACTKQKTLNVEGTSIYEVKPLAYTGNKQLVLDNLDNLGRATNAHIQLRKADLPHRKRNERLYINPSGWHNYKIKDKNDNYYWAYNRGHLIGYQFSGLNDEKRNLITMTRTLNSGGTKNIDPNNQEGMLYYEYAIRKYIDEHPNQMIDYQVTPLYKNDELMARGVRLSYVAYNSCGKQIKMNISSPYVKYQGKVAVVKLPNKEPGLDINYQTGQAQILNKK